MKTRKKQHQLTQEALKNVLNLIFSVIGTSDLKGKAPKSLVKSFISRLRYMLYYVKHFHYFQ